MDENKKLLAVINTFTKLTLLFVCATSVISFQSVGANDETWVKLSSRNLIKLIQKEKNLFKMACNMFIYLSKANL